MLPCRKVWLPSFIAFQVSTLSRDCKAHGPIFTSLEKHGINPETLSPIGYPIPYGESADRVCNTHKEQEKEKEKVTAKEKEKEKAAAKANSPEEVEDFAVSIGCLPGQGTAAFWKWQGNGWINGKAAIKDWRATVRAWKAQGFGPFKDEAAKPVQVSFALQDKERKDAERHGPEIIPPKIIYSSKS